MYDPQTPPGYGDQTYIYAIRPSALGFANGSDHGMTPIEIQDADFVCRSWAGADSILTTGAPVSGNGTIQIYNAISQGWYKTPTLIPANFPTGQSVVPECIYPANSALRFDTTNLALDVSSGGGVDVPVDQLCFYGVRRFQNVGSDPLRSSYQYYEKDYAIPFQFTLTDRATAAGAGLAIQLTTQINDYDFELRRIEAGKITGGVYTQLSATAPEFQMTLYDPNWVKRSNIPINSNRLFHFPLSIANPMNSWPSPPILYPVNSVIRMDVASLIPPAATLPTIILLFKGVRRIPLS